MLDAALYCKKSKQVHRKTDPEKLERHGNKPSTISQSDDHISMLLRVNKKTDRYPEHVKKKYPRMIDSKLKHLLNDIIGPLTHVPFTIPHLLW